MLIPTMDNIPSDKSLTQVSGEVFAAFPAGSTNRETFLKEARREYDCLPSDPDAKEVLVMIDFARRWEYRCRCVQLGAFKSPRQGPPELFTSDL